MQKSIRNTVGVGILVAAATISGTWCEVDCPEEDSYVEIEYCPHGQVQIGYITKVVKKFTCYDMDRCTGSRIAVCVACVITQYEIEEPNCVDRPDYLDMPDPFTDGYGG